MIRRFILWNSRNEIYEKWHKKRQWYVMIPIWSLFLFLVINPFSWERNLLFGIIYWGVLFLINLNTLYTFLIMRPKKLLKKYIEYITKYDKVVCGWDDEDLEKGKTYKIDKYSYEEDTYYIKLNTPSEIKNFYISDWNKRVFKLVPTKEYRRLKLKQIGL